MILRFFYYDRLISVSVSESASSFTNLRIVNLEFQSVHSTLSREWPWNRREVVYPKNTTAASSHRPENSTATPYRGRRAKSKPSPYVGIYLG